MSDRGSFNCGLGFMGRLDEARAHVRRGAISEALKILQGLCSVLEAHGAEGYRTIEHENHLKAANEEYLRRQQVRE